MFQSRKLNYNTWVISGEGCDCYLLEGTEEAVMIDAGEAKENIRTYAQSLTELPLSKVINTHAHFDHTGGNGYFDTVITTVGVARSAKNTMGASPEDYPLDYGFTYVKDGDVIDIKGRPLTVILLDCHSPEDIALLDTENRMLFSGDEVESGQVLLLPGYAEEPGQIHAKPAATVETCLNAMLRLKAEEPRFDHLYPAHNGTPIAREYLDWYICLCRGIIDGSIIGNTDCSSPSYNASATHFPNPDAHYRRAEHKGATLIYCDRLIHDEDYVNADQLPPATPLHVISADCARKP